MQCGSQRNFAAIAAALMMCVEWRTVRACLGGALPGACCSPAVPTCTNPCPQAYTAPQQSYGGYGNSYSTDSSPYGGESYGSGGGGYGGSGGEYGSRPSNIDKHGNYGGESSYGGKPSYGELPYGGGRVGEGYGSLPAPSPYAAPPSPYSSSSYGQLPQPTPSYGNQQQLLPSSYGQGLPYPAGIQPSYPGGSAAYLPQVPQQGGGIPYSNALKPFTLAALDQQQQQFQQQQGQYFPPGPSGLTDGYVGVGEPTVYPVPPYPSGGIRSPFFSRARKASAAGKKIVTVTTMTTDDLNEEKKASSKKKE